VPMEVLVAEPVVEAADRCTFESAGRRVVKGFEGVVTVQSLIGADVRVA